MWMVSGVSGAAPVWADVMNWLEQNGACTAPPAPAGLIGQRIHFAHDLEAEHSGWFIAGTQQDTFTPDNSPRPQVPRIFEPSEGTIIALDPEKVLNSVHIQVRGTSVIARRVITRWHPHKLMN